MTKDSKDSSTDIIYRGVKSSDSGKEAKSEWKKYFILIGFLCFLIFEPNSYLSKVFGIEQPNTLLMFYLFLLVGFSLVRVYRISSRARHRFTLTSLLGFTTVVALYANMFASMGEKKELFSSPSSLNAFVVGWGIAVAFNLIMSRCLFFRGAWGIPRKNGTEIVPTSWYWPSQLLIALLIFGLWVFAMQGIDTWVDFYTASDWYLMAMIIAVMSHIMAVRRTSISIYQEGVELVGMIWLWEKGPLKLYQLNDEYRLGPEHLVDNNSWRRYLWPIVPEEYLEEVHRLILRKQEASEIAEG